MNDNFGVGFALGAVITFVLTILISSTSFERALKDQQQKAIEAGVARWVVNPSTGETSFQYGK